MHPYLISVIMAVYNVESYLPEAIESVIGQTIGFRNIQLILVNDGSTDGSGTICDTYAARYPENIQVVHKENGGVSSARNTGLALATGKYLNFMDADDTLSDNVCCKVTEFFDRHFDDIDVVAFPMFFFDGKTGPHILNGKFAKGSRILDLRREFDAIQLSTASAFVKHRTVQRLNLRFDTRLSFTEDAKFLTPLLMETMRMGVVSTCRYRVRRRTGGAASATQQSASRKEWWLDTLMHFQLDILHRCMDSAHRVPRFVQYLLAYDLQWRLQQPDIPQNLLTCPEIARYRSMLCHVLSHIDDEIIWMQRHIWREHKIHALSCKYRREPERIATGENIQYYFGEREVFSLMEDGLTLTSLRIRKGCCQVEGFLTLYAPFPEDILLEAHSGSGRYVCVPAPAPQLPPVLGENGRKTLGFLVTIPLPESGQSQSIRFIARWGNSRVVMHRFRLGKFFPLTRSYPESGYRRNGWQVTCRKNELLLSRCGFWKYAKSQLAFLRALLRSGQTGAKKAAAARLFCHLLRPLLPKPLLLLSDRVDRGGDNGEAMFRYIRTHHRREVTAVFIVSRDSPDFQRLQKIGPVADVYSYRHKLLYLLCACNLSSGAEVHMINPFTGYDAPYRDLISDIPFVFLQHGVTKDDISSWVNRFDKSVSAVVAASPREYQAFLGQSYGFTPESVWLTGFPRFDRLYDNRQKVVTVMPTWRKHLAGALDPGTGLWSLAPDFGESEFVTFYRNLLNHPALHHALRRTGYTLRFFPHPNLLPGLSDFSVPEYVKIPAPDTPYPELFAESALLVTDYSSTAFDFAYLRKPVLYCQFDADTFFSGSHSYRKGYFDYQRDGFGAAAYTLEETVRLLITHLENDCRMETVYRRRADEFFLPADRSNCRRVYENVKELLAP